jgi:NAD(P)-dependent dehydrogenase (short-subunit alcohol dehydrogenase family)
MKNYLIIGASSGIGKQLAETLSSEGHQVYGTFCNTIVEQSSSAVQYHHLDVTASTLNLDFLPEQLHGVAYCPGSIQLKPFARLKPESFAKDFDLQVLGAVKVIQEVLPRLKAAGHASIVLFSTVAVQTGFTFHAQVAASKGALEGLTRALAAEFAPAIRVNAVAPSLTDTPLSAQLLNTEEKKEANAQRHPLKKIGTASDIAGAAAFLLSDKAAWISGQIMHVDGGMSAIKN